MAGSPEECRAIAGGAIARFASYSAGDETIAFRIATCTCPDWDGTEQKRAPATR